jgi:hypothetical protein
LRTVKDASGDLDMDVVPRPRPVEQRIPRFRLTRDEIPWRVGAVAQQVAFAVARQTCCEDRLILPDPVDRGVREAGEWHGKRIDFRTVADRAPFVGDRFRQR